MQNNGPLNRKKNVTGTASADSMKTQGPGMGGGPVGEESGYQERKEQQAARPAQRAGNSGNPFASKQTPLNRPKQVSGQASGSMQTHGPGMGGPSQQARPTGSGQQNRPNPFAAPNQTRPQQQRPTTPPQSQARPQQQRPAALGGAPAGGSAPTNRASGKKISPLLLIVVIAVVLLGGGGGLSGLFGGGSSNSSSGSSSGLGSLLNDTLSGGGSSGSSSGLGSLLGDTLSGGGSSGSSSGLGSMLGGLLGGYSASSLEDMLGGSWFSSQTGYGASDGISNAYSFSGGSSAAAYTGSLNREVAPGSRAKYTSLLGNGRDQVTLMVYMCGADLESRSGMATRDLQEMLNASFGGNLRLIVYTGGASAWKNNKISSRVNQIWQIENGSLKCLNDNAGTGAMTDPATLSSFIQYCAGNFKANRYALILWDHGSGSVNGYGYDEKNTRAGAMSLAGLNQAFRNGGVKFDFIGFDTCLMATVENALMCGKYADYLIASEETEPGVGWYYTDWLTAWGKNPSLSTLELGKQICDDFVAQCKISCRGQQTTLSLVDLAELEHTVPSRLKTFAQGVTKLVSGREYKAVSNARNGSREFGVSAKVDMVDLTDLCNKLNTTESAALAKTVQSAVKYNRTGNISSAYGLSIYFPYQKMSNVDKAVNAYAAIGMDESYGKAIRAFASVEAGGQAVSGGSASAVSSLFGMLGSSGSGSYGGGGSADLVGDLLSSFLGGGFGRVAGLNDGNTAFLTAEQELSAGQLTEILAGSLLDASQLVFAPDGEGGWALEMRPEQWALITGADQNVFYDNGQGYVDLGLDNLFSFDSQGRMKADMDGTWLALNGQPVAYYRESAQRLENGGWIITGRTPALLNGQRVDLLIVFDDQNENGYVAGARAVYGDETEMVAKADTEIQPGDTIQLLADLYDYQQNYTDNYRLGKALTVNGELQVSNVYLPDPSKMLVTYRFTDLYHQTYWTPVIGK